MNKVIIIGGGAAGLLAAISAAQRGADVTILERMERAGRKLMITGKGRCNITNHCTMDEMIAHIPGNGKFLFGAFHRFTNEDMIALLESHGLKTKVERGGRVFPQSDKASDVVRTLEGILYGLGGKIFFHRRITQLACQEGKVSAVYDTDGRYYEADTFIIAAGGASYPRTGSTGDGYDLAQQAGHTIIAPSPALVPLNCDLGDMKALQGLSLRNVEASLWDKGKLVGKEFGEMLFTHFGVSGPIILTLSREAARYFKAHPQGFLNLSIDLKPALTREQLDARLQRDFQKYSRKGLKAGMHDLLPQALIPFVIEEACLVPEQPVNQLTRKERLRLVDVLKGFPLPVTGTRPLEEAIVTSGGVSIKEISPSTFASRLYPNLFFAGEVMDVDGFTGGYNLQAAFSSGYVAGKEAAEL